MAGIAGTAAREAPRALARAAVYRVLAVGLEEPDEELVAVLRSGELIAEVEDALEVLWHDEADAAAVTEGLREATNAARHEVSSTVLEELRTEYARLLTGPGLTAVAGFESQHAGGHGDPAAPVFGAVTTAVAEALAEEGVRAAAGLPADRATAEAEFLAIDLALIVQGGGNRLELEFDFLEAGLADDLHHLFGRMGVARDRRPARGRTTPRRW